MTRARKPAETRRVPAPRNLGWFRIGPFGLPVPRLGVGVSDGWLAVLMVLPALLLMSIYLAYPLWSVVSSSFLQWDKLNEPGHWVGLQNYRWLLSGEDFLPTLGRTLYYTFWNIVLQTVLALAIALLLNLKLPGRNIARGAILFPFVMPAVVAAIIWTYMLDDLRGVVSYLLLSGHLISRPLGLLSSPSTAMNTVIAISVWKFMPFWVTLFLARLQTIPTEIVEAAQCDGASSWRVFRHIIWPWLLPVVLVAMMLRTILSFNEFDMPFLLAHGGPLNSVQVLSVLIRHLVVDNIDLGKAAAVSVVMIAFLVAASLVYVAIYRRGERLLQG